MAKQLKPKCKTELGRLLGLPVDREHELVNLLKGSRGTNFIRRISYRQCKSDPDAKWRVGTGRPNGSTKGDYYIDQSTNNIYQRKRDKYVLLGNVNKKGVPKAEKLYGLRVCDDRGFLMCISGLTFDEDESIEHQSEVLRLMGHGSNLLGGFFDDLEGDDVPDASGFFADINGFLADLDDDEEEFSFGDDLDDEPDEEEPQALSAFRRGDLVYDVYTKDFWKITKQTKTWTMLRSWDTNKDSQVKNTAERYLPAHLE